MKKFFAILLLAFVSNALFAWDWFWKETNAEEFINVQTNFVFALEDGSNKQTMIYGARDGSDIGQYFLPIFKVNQEVYLYVEMTPTLLPSATAVHDDEKSSKREIAVEIVITKSKKITVTETSGMNIQGKEDIDGTYRCTFSIKNIDMQRSLAFKFTPSVVGDAKVVVRYSAADNGLKIVDKTCDVFQTVKFTR